MLLNQILTKNNECGNYLAYLCCTTWRHPIMHLCSSEFNTSQIQAVS